jgi:hypothetical protein
MEDLLSFLGKEPMITIFILFAYYQWVTFIIKKIEARSWFSAPYLKTMKWLFAILLFFAFLGGTLDDLKYEFRLALLEPAGLFFSFVPYFIGSLLGLTIFTILLTYLVRLITPILKSIHDKTNN